MDSTDSEKKDKPGPVEFTMELGRETAKELLKETKTMFKWGLYGALGGCVVLGMLGFWKLGFIGLGIGAVGGSILGGAGAVYVYSKATSLVG
jgi:hypothetical protein